MSAPIPPPKKKDRKLVSKFAAAGNGHNVVRNFGNNGTQLEDANLESYSKICNFSDPPDSIIGTGVELKGDFQYDQLLRIDGSFKGNLITNGDLIIGHTGCLIGDVTTVNRMIIDGGFVSGTIIVQELLLKGQAQVQGDISCKLMEILGPDVILSGKINVHPLSPDKIDENENIVYNGNERKNSAEKSPPSPLKNRRLIHRNPGSFESKHVDKTEEPIEAIKPLKPSSKKHLRNNSIYNEIETDEVNSKNPMIIDAIAAALANVDQSSPFEQNSENPSFQNYSNQPFQSGLPPGDESNNPTNVEKNHISDFNGFDMEKPTTEVKKNKTEGFLRSNSSPDMNLSGDIKLDKSLEKEEGNGEFQVQNERENASFDQKEEVDLNLYGLANSNNLPTSEQNDLNINLTETKENKEQLEVKFNQDPTDPENIEVNKNNNLEHLTDLQQNQMIEPSFINNEAPELLHRQNTDFTSDDLANPVISEIDPNPNEIEEPNREINPPWTEQNPNEQQQQQDNNPSFNTEDQAPSEPESTEVKPEIIEPMISNEMNPVEPIAPDNFCTTEEANTDQVEPTYEENPEPTEYNVEPSITMSPEPTDVQVDTTDEINTEPTDQTNPAEPINEVNPEPPSEMNPAEEPTDETSVEPIETTELIGETNSGAVVEGSATVDESEEKMNPVENTEPTEEPNNPEPTELTPASEEKGEENDNDNMNTEQNDLLPVEENCENIEKTQDTNPDEINSPTTEEINLKPSDQSEIIPNPDGFNAEPNCETDEKPTGLEVEPEVSAEGDSMEPQAEQKAGEQEATPEADADSVHAESGSVDEGNNLDGIVGENGVGFNVDQGNEMNNEKGNDEESAGDLEEKMNNGEGENPLGMIPGTFPGLMGSAAPPFQQQWVEN